MYDNGQTNIDIFRNLELKNESLSRLSKSSEFLQMKTVNAFLRILTFASEGRETFLYIGKRKDPRPSKRKKVLRMITQYAIQYF